MSGLAVLAIQSQQVLVCNYIIRLQRSDELMRESRAEQSSQVLGWSLLLESRRAEICQNRGFNLFNVTGTKFELSKLCPRKKLF